LLKNEKRVSSRRQANDEQKLVDEEEGGCLFGLD